MNKNYEINRIKINELDRIFESVFGDLFAKTDEIIKEKKDLKIEEPVVTFTIWENSYDSRNGKRVPTLVINKNGEDLYLQPFRYYRMQVSDTIRQIGCRGDSEVLGLLNLVMMAEAKKFFKTDIDVDGFQCNVDMLTGLIDQLSQVALSKCYNEEDMYYICISSEYSKFINETIEYLKSRCNELALKMVTE